MHVWGAAINNQPGPLLLCQLQPWIPGSSSGPCVQAEEELGVVTAEQSLQSLQLSCLFQSHGCSCSELCAASAHGL